MRINDVVALIDNFYDIYKSPHVKNKDEVEKMIFSWFESRGIVIDHSNPVVQREQEVTVQKIVRNIIEWQLTPWVHPLTCGVNSSHRNLVPRVEKLKLWLDCLDCNYRQKTIPEFFFTNDFQVPRKPFT